jgi:hypothetical protein
VSSIGLQILEGGAGTIVVQRLQEGGVGGGERLAVDEVAEEVAVAQERELVLLVAAGGSHDLVLVPVDDLDRLALLVDPLGVARP